MSEISHSLPHHQARSPLMLLEYLFDPPGKSISCSEEYAGRSHRFRDKKQIKSFRTGVTLSPITAVSPSFSTAASASGTSTISILIIHFDRAHPLSPVINPIISRSTSLPPSLNPGQALTFSALIVQASRVSIITWSISGVHGSHSIQSPSSNTVVSCFPLVILSFPYSGFFSHSRIIGSPSFSIAASAAGSSTICILITLFDRAQPLSPVINPIFSRFTSLLPSLNPGQAFTFSALTVQASRVFVITWSISGVRGSHSTQSPSSNTVPPPLFSSPRLLAILILLSNALSAPTSQTATMENNQGQPSNQGQNNDPMGKLFNNKECNMCLAHTIMINSVKKQIKELSEDYYADRESKRKKLGKRKKEIEALKDRCIHMEAVIDHLRTLTESNQAEASTKASAQKEDSVTPHFP